MTCNLDPAYGKCKSTVFRSRVDLTSLAAHLARPFVTLGSLSTLAFAHDPGCPLEERPDASECRCAPTIDLLIYDPSSGGFSVSVRLMEEGTVVDAPVRRPSR
jgi:hypothetical protein